MLDVLGFFSLGVMFHKNIVEALLDGIYSFMVGEIHGS